jgi:hypothetical protein
MVTDQSTSGGKAGEKNPVGRVLKNQILFH